MFGKLETGVVVDDDVTEFVGSLGARFELAFQMAGRHVLTS